MDELRALGRHPATRTLLGTAVGYGLILAVLTLLVFVLPYLLFRML